MIRSTVPISTLDASLAGDLTLPAPARGRVVLGDGGATTATVRRFADRRDAGARLAEMLGAYAHAPDVIVLAIPRGGAPVADEVARALAAPLGTVVVRKVLVPGHHQEVIGAIGPEGVLVTDPACTSHACSHAELSAELVRERLALRRRERLLTAGMPTPPVLGKTVIVVDDGMTSGSSMRAAVAWARLRLAARVVVAVPIAPAETVRRLALEADQVVCVATPADFRGIADAYEDYHRVSEGDVVRILLRGVRPGRATRPRELRP
jgi:putative phosphoribosyl transferase